MLKRIKVRSKLLVLVITPLIALAAFAATGVGERLESSEFFSRETRIAELADAGADLTVAVHVERNRTLRAHAGGAVDIEGAVTATDIAVDRWLVAAATARTEVTGAVVDDIDAFAVTLSAARASRSGSDMAVVADQLLRVGRSVNSITIGLISQAEDLELYRALSAYIQLSRVEFGVAEITTIGAQSVAADGIATGDFALLRAADAAVDGGIEQFQNFADPVFVAQLQGLVDSGLLPQMEATDPILELQFFINRPDRSTATIDWLEQGEDRLVAIHQVSSALLDASSDSAELAATSAAGEARSFLILAGAVIVGGPGRGTIDLPPTAAPDRHRRAALVRRAAGTCRVDATGQWLDCQRAHPDRHPRPRRDRQALRRHFRHPGRDDRGGRGARRAASKTHLGHVRQPGSS